MSEETKLVGRQVFDKCEPKKHSVCYKTSDKTPVMTSVYVMKEYLKAPYPKRIVVTIEIPNEVA